MGLREYKKKRDFRRTPEPPGEVQPDTGRRMYVIQKHSASRLHYDLRLEMEGVLKSWAVPKGPSLDPGEKRLAVHVEDHPVEYGAFEGVIPEKEYGGGTVMLWDRGEWFPDGDASAKYRKGHLTFRLNGEKLKGSWTLARMGGKAGEEGKNWLLIKRSDEEAKSDRDILKDDLSVATGRSMDEIRKSRDRVWSGTEGEISESRQSEPQPASKNPPDPAALPGARRSAMPSETKPQLATPVKEPPQGGRWIHEVKYDGYRILCFKKGKTVRLVSRNGNDWTSRFGSIAGNASSLRMKNAILDGEVVVLRPDGTTDFQALQNAFEGLLPWGKIGRIGYYVFDILFYEGYDLTRTPLLHRKRLLKDVLANGAPPSLLYGDHIEGRGRAVYDQACRLGMEGIVSKREDSRYEQRRSANWLKTKCVQRQEFVIGGYSEPSGSRFGFGALLIGFYNDSGELTYAGRVGTGFNETTLRRMMKALKPREQDKSPFRNPPKGADARGVHWVRPELVAEVEFTEWTKEGILRHPSFKGLREDKSPLEIGKETSDAHTSAEANPVRSSGHSKGNTIAGVSLTNPERIFYPEQGLTKISIAEYYESVADLIIPHLEDRPLSLVRCPQGHQRKCFYQKHLTEQTPSVLKQIPVREKEEVGMYVAVRDLKGLISLVQLGVLEFHPWGSKGDRLEQPDRLIFDLDPGESLTAHQLVKSVQLLRSFLEDMGLVCFLKATGGKGYHVVAPIVRGPTWEELKEFAKRVAQQLVRMEPDLLVSVMTKSKRKGKVFLDYLRNGRGSTAVAPYSTRARLMAPVAAPLSWNELTPEVAPDRFKVENGPDLLSRPDPWADFFSVRQAITKTMMRRLGM
ncbi:MAG: DNA ligase D [Desulfobacteraceae bacterium]|nr:MAG: DNA ligase D [Desulfobacteraceae bacterium]